MKREAYGRRYKRERQRGGEDTQCHVGWLEGDTSISIILVLLANKGLGHYCSRVSRRPAESVGKLEEGWEGGYSCSWGVVV